MPGGVTRPRCLELGSSGRLARLAWSAGRARRGSQVCGVPWFLIGTPGSSVGQGLQRSPASPARAEAKSWYMHECRSVANRSVLTAALLCGEQRTSVPWSVHLMGALSRRSRLGRRLLFVWSPTARVSSSPQSNVSLRPGDRPTPQTDSPARAVRTPLSPSGSLRQ